MAREEIFGPVLVVIPHDGDDDAVALANDSPYGLSGSVWSGDRDRAMAVAQRIRTGTVGVNGGLWYSPDVPFGGYKQSGVGREMGVGRVRGVPRDQVHGGAGMTASEPAMTTRGLIRPRARGMAKMQEVYGFSVDPDRPAGRLRRLHRRPPVRGRVDPARAGRPRPRL